MATEMQFGALVDTNITLRSLDDARPITIDRIVFFVVVLCETARGEAVPADGGERDGVSINAAAASLGRSFETARRHVNGLIADGLCERVGRAVRVRPDVLASDPVQRLLTRFHDRLVRMVYELGRLGVTPPASRPDAAYDPAHGIGIALGLALSPFEPECAGRASWNEMVVLNAIISANIRAVTFDREMAQHYAGIDDAPPDAVRRPVTAASVAQALNLPYPTVRRHIGALAAASLVKRREGGYVVAQATVETEAFVHMGLVSARNAMTAVERLARAGFDVERPARHYLVAPIDPIPFAGRRW
ncbi:winged helix-turn-helix domain-containing protein [Sphingomonas donggukensis]|uniref:Winged helix-turn-helix domain-containing protein n=1 Tax=Sphingomonas donggukensis TaxID=2949093 RepID=A0ABY4TWY0_9SPHN|nr:winged helix-turn-helix domain-containing protein [Sphingomonas donggukensis]URW75664.1 winged helix-turn-helix domain-containing protein [Sphingomonas donggukensis]